MVDILRTTSNAKRLLCSNLATSNQKFEFMFKFKENIYLMAFINIMVDDKHVTLNPPPRNCPKLPAGKTFFLEAPRPQKYDKKIKFCIF